MIEIKTVRAKFLIVGEGGSKYAKGKNWNEPWACIRICVTDVNSLFITYR